MPNTPQNTPPGRMHADEIPVTASMVHRLLAAQFPHWADLPLTAVSSAGTDHALYRLGHEFVIRLPRVPSAAEQGLKEYRWLPVFAPHLPLALPVPLALGQPDAQFPYHWTICRWLEGENVSLDQHGDSIEIAQSLAQFVKTLHQLNASDGPPPGAHNFGRGVPLAHRDEATRHSIASLKDLMDTDAALAAWEHALSAAPWQGNPVWIHGDLQAGNLLVHQDRLSAVIDFGGMAVGDPACDMQVAWNLFTHKSREAFRRMVAPDDATWARGRGWVLSVAVRALPYYLNSNPQLVAISRRAISAVLSDPAD